jgi:Protein of unknown function (DUF2971)
LLSATPPPELLHHYTDRAGLGGIIESKKLWATHIRHLNDDSEIRYSRELLEAVAERLKPEFGSDWAAGVVCDAVAALANSETTPDTFVASFCDDGDNLSQWRGYGAQGHGFAIGFNRERLRLIAQAQGYQLVRLMYVKSEQEEQFETALRDAVPIVAGWGADRTTAPPAVQQLLLLGIAFTLATLSVKNPYFKDEKEWRLAHLILPGLFDGHARARRTSDGEIPYEEIALVDQTTAETPFAEVVIGPMARSHTSVEEVRSLLDRNDLELVSIRTSLVPLRH